MKTWKLKEITAKLNQILTGYYHYYGITDNTERIEASQPIFCGFSDVPSSPSLHPAHQSVQTDRTSHKCKSLPGYCPELWVSLLLLTCHIPVIPGLMAILAL